MKEPVIRLLIADDNAELCDILADYFGLTPGIEVCGLAKDGEEALFRIAQTQPDVVLLDLILPKVDGISVLERLERTELPRRPRVIVTSALGQEKITGAALSMGADYYMIKPYDLDALCARVRLVAEQETLPQQPDAAEEPADAVIRALTELDMPTHMLGYQYCISALSIMMRGDRPLSLVKDVYAGVAKEYETTSGCVESAIRQIIRRLWEQGRDRMNQLPGLGDTTLAPPSNGRFLNAVKVRLSAQAL